MPQQLSQLPNPFPPAWASAWGEDKDYGLYAIFTLDGVSQVCRWIAPGSFLMGSPEDEAQRFDNETRHPVILTQGYWLADSACTQALWQAVMGDNPSHFKDSPQHPVEMVSWDEVQTFLARLNTMIPGLDAGLPSEAQWEYACRAGTVTPFALAEITPEQVNYDGNYPYADGKKGEYREKTVAVKSLPCNAWGLHEMHGNVWEWCADWFGAYAEGPQIDPLGPASGVERVLRGGSWNRIAGFCRSASRFGSAPVVRSRSFGFRLAPGQGLSQAGAEAARRPTGQQAERNRQGGGSAAGGGDAGF